MADQPDIAPAFFAGLPSRAVVAFAARAARRVLPLFNDGRPDAPIEHRKAVYRAVAAAEKWAAGIVNVAERSVAAEANEAAVARCSDVAFAAARAAHALLAAHGGYASDAAFHASRAAQAALAAITDTEAAREARYVMVRDVDLLRQSANREIWTEDTSVAPEFFGPVWPEGAPANWPDEEPNSERAELVLTLDVPEGLSEREVRELVVGLATRADALHRAYGGHGLEVEEGNVEVDRAVHQPTPKGGRK